MDSNYVILLPNSEGKNKGGDEKLTYRFVSNLKKYNSFMKLQSSRDYIIDEIKKLIRSNSEEELSTFFELKGENLKFAISTMSALKDEECMSVIERMAGVMYNSINYSSLNQEQKKYFNDSIVILDALFGLLKPQDLIPNYKCKVSMKLFDTTLAKYWQRELEGYFEFISKDKLVIDLLPNSHKEMISKCREINRVEIIFARKHKDSYKLEGHASKELKGEFVQYVVGFNSISKEDLKKFKHSTGHKYHEKFSTEEKFIYLG